MGAPAGRDWGKLLGRLPPAERLAKKLATEAGMLEGRARCWTTALAVTWATERLSNRLRIEAGILDGIGPLGIPVGAPEGRVPVGKKVAMECGMLVGTARFAIAPDENTPV